MDVLTTAFGTGLRYQLNNGSGHFGSQVAVGVGAPLGGNLSIAAPVDVDADGDVDLFLFQVRVCERVFVVLMTPPSPPPTHTHRGST